MPDSLTIAFDLEHERQASAGVTRCARALASAMSERADVSLVPIGGGPLIARGSLRKKLTTARQDFWWYPFEGRRRARAARADVYHCPSPRAPVTAGNPPTVVTIHDLASFRYPETLTRWTRFYERATLPRVARSADLIIAQSSDTAADIEQILRVSSSKIRIVPLGVDAHFFVRDNSGSPFSFPYVLFVGTPQPRKNLERLVSAIDRLASAGQQLRLVVAGSDGWGAVDLEGRNVTVVGRVTDDQLRTLYRHAKCVALVSLHEGFGLPVLEAMAVGVPVVASTAGALPETAGGAAVLVDPFDVKSIASGIEEAVARRDVLVSAGLRRAAACSWRKAAELTVAVYRELV